MFIIRSIRSRLPNVRGKVREVEIGMKEATRAAHTHLNDGCGRRRASAHCTEPARGRRKIIVTKLARNFMRVDWQRAI